MNHELPAAVLKQIQTVLSHYPSVKKAVLYGSRAKGTNKPGSDIDLTLMGEGLDASCLGRIDDELEELLLPWRFDLSLFDQLTHAELIAHIRRVGKVLYERHGAAEPQPA
jgi:predicted nucleotidyltransferase